MSTLIDTTPHLFESSEARAGRGRVTARPLRALRTLGATALVAGLGLTAGCASDPACRKAGVAGTMITAGRTTGEAVATGAKTAVEGVKAGGRAVGGMVEGGAPKAEEKWNEGKQDTKATAREGASEVDEEANLPICAAGQNP